MRRLIADVLFDLKLVATTNELREELDVCQNTSRFARLVASDLPVQLVSTLYSWRLATPRNASSLWLQTSTTTARAFIESLGMPLFTISHHFVFSVVN
jgi:hypothetical protein